MLGLRLTLPLAPAAVALLLTLTACWRYDPLYCDEQADCADNPGLTFCDLNGTFPASEGIGRTCIPDPGGTCAGDADCDDPMLPACVSGVCRQCNAMHACAPAAPVCDVASSTCGDCRTDDDCAAFSDQTRCAADGACVGCRDDNDCAAGNACDDETRQCSGCMQDSDCDSGICDGNPKTCVPTANILYVTATGTGTDCTKAAPCGTIAQAHQRVAGLRTYILLGPGAYDGGELRDKAFTMVGNGATIVTALSLLGDITVERITLRAPLSTGGGRTIRLDAINAVDVTAADISQAAINISDATVTITGSVVANTKVGSGIIVSQLGELHMSDTQISGSEIMGVNIFSDAPRTNTIHRSKVIANGTGGIFMNVSHFAITNSWVVNNRGYGVYFSKNIASGQLEHNTIVGNNVGIRCNEIGLPVFRNNLVANNGQEGGSQISDCASQYTLVWPTGAPAGTGNVGADPRFVDPAANNFHVRSDSPARRAADPNRARTSPAVTVTDDIDGQPRAASGQADIGADEFVP